MKMSLLDVVKYRENLIKNKAMDFKITIHYAHLFQSSFSSELLLCLTIQNLCPVYLQRFQ